MDMGGDPTGYDGDDRGDGMGGMDDGRQHDDGGGMDGMDGMDGMEGGSQGEETDEEDMDEIERHIGENPLMARVHEAMHIQLKNQDERAELELREREEELRRFKKKREDTGVELYGVQQQLAKLQLSLEEKHNTLTAIQNESERSEVERQRANEEHMAAKEELVEEQKQMQKNQTDLDALNATVRQVEEYAEEMKSEILVTRRATYKAEENIQGLEKGKKHQDVYIDTLNEQLKRLQESLALFDAQFESQRQETKTALDTLLDASKEMESISFEKQQLMQQWKSSLIGMQRRDEALQATNEALREQEERGITIQSEVDGFKHSIAAAQSESEKLTGIMTKLESESRFLQEKLSAIREDRRKVAERYAVLKKSLESTDAELSKAEQAHRFVSDNIQSREQALQTVQREAHLIELSIGAYTSEQVTVSKAAKNLHKQADAVQVTIHLKEVEASQMKNELARIKVDVLNTDAHTVQLRETLSRHVDDLKQKDELIEKYELEIRQRNDEIEKKMYVVDRLNRKHDSLTEGLEEENLGPLEATIRNIRKTTASTADDNRVLERRWLKTQTELVGVLNETDEVTTKTRELSSQETILVQKRVRLDKQIAAQEVDIRQLRTSIGGLHQDMTRLNTLIAESEGKQEDFANQNFALETSFVNELREMEEESVRMDHYIRGVKAEKKALLEEILESERQIVLWEKKIQLEKETRAALDPEVGQSEARSMEKEIHRMRLRFDTLKRDQERMIKEMERCIMKRETISVKARGKKDAGLTQASLRKNLLTKRSALKKLAMEGGGVDQDIDTVARDMQDVSSQLEGASKEYSAVEDDANRAQREINDKLYEKQQNVEMLSRNKRLSERYEKTRENPTMALGEIDAGRVENEMRRELACNEDIQDVIMDLQQKHGHLAEVLQRVLKMAQM